MMNLGFFVVLGLLGALATVVLTVTALVMHAPRSYPVPPRDRARLLIVFVIGLTLVVSLAGVALALLMLSRW